MSKLIVLSEVNCLKILEYKGLQLDEFYTDFNLFRNRSSSFTDANVVIIFTGSCRFSKKHVFETIKVLEARVNEEYDNGIKSVTVISDSMLPSVNKYYKFQGSLDNISEYSGWSLKKKTSDIWGRIPKGSGEPVQLFLTDFDTGNINNLKISQVSLHSSDESLRKLIRKPDFSSISEI